MNAPNRVFHWKIIDICLGRVQYSHTTEQKRDITPFLTLKIFVAGFIIERQRRVSVNSQIYQAAVSTFIDKPEVGPNNFSLSSLGTATETEAGSSSEM